MAIVPITVGSMVLICTRARLHGQVVICTFYYRTIEPIEDWFVSAPDLATSFGDLVDQPMATFQSNEVIDRQISIQVVAPTFRTRNVTIASDNETGGVSANSLPTVCSAVVKKLTPKAGQAERGRVYIPGIPVTYEQDSRLNALGLTALADVALGMQEPVPLTETQANTLQPVLWNPKSSPNFSKNITACEPSPIIRVQRRREVGVGI